MPILKSSKKRVKLALRKQARNYNTRTAMKKAIRRVEEAVKAGDAKQAEVELTTAYKVIDTATKKNVIQKNTASRRKSKLARSIAGISKKKAPAVKKAPAKKAVAKKAAPKKAAAKKKAPAKKEEAKAE
jgi:ribosomal protein S20